MEGERARKSSSEELLNFEIDTGVRKRDRSKRGRHLRKRFIMSEGRNSQEIKLDRAVESPSQHWFTKKKGQGKPQEHNRNLV